MSDRWAVATCPSCKTALIIDRAPTTGALTVECHCGARLERHSRAGSDHKVPRVHATASSRPEAAEQRGRLLASRWGNGQGDLYREFDDIDTGEAAAEAAEERLDRLNEPFADEADAAVDQYETALGDEANRALSRWDAVLAEEAEDYLEQARWRQVFAESVSEHTDERWADEAAAALDRHDTDPDGTPDPGPQRGSLTLTTQQGVAPTIEVALNGPFSEVWQQFVASTTVQQAFLRAVRQLADGRTVPELFDECARLGLRPELQSWVVDIARGHHRRAWAFCNLLPKLGTDIGRREDQRALARVLRHNDRPLTVAVHCSDAFQERRRDQRIEILECFVDISQGLDVRFIATGRVQRWLRSSHDEQLPARASDDCTDSGPTRPDEAAVERAVDVFDPDRRPAEILRALSTQPSETLAYAELYQRFPDVSQGAVRQSIGHLADHACIIRAGADRSKRVELTATGAAVLDRLDAIYGRQSELPTGVSDPASSAPQDVYPEQAREGGSAPTCGGSGEQSTYYFSGWLSRSHHAGIAAAAPAGQIATVKDDFTETLANTASLNRFRGVSYDADRREVAVSVPAGSPLQVAASTATALATPWFLQRVLEGESLDPADSEVLRSARCIGALSDDALEDMDTLRAALIEWGEGIASDTRKLQNTDENDISDRDKFIGQILRDSKGLAGTIVHLLDHLGISIRRELRVPNGLDTGQREKLAYSIAHSAAIESKYEEYAAYRQLFEPREDKRAGAREAEVDASDPIGEYIGSLVLRGADVHRLRPHLEEALESPAPVHEDAPELAISVNVSRAGREATATAAKRVVSSKRLRLSRPVVSLLDGLTTPYGAARALQSLESETVRRDIRPDELRYALATLPPSELLAECPGSVGEMFSALLRADCPLSKTDLADRADVCLSTVSTYDDFLVAVGLMVETPAGCRVEISFRDERDDPVLPDVVQESTTLTDIAADLLDMYLPTERYIDKDDELGGLLFWPPDPLPLLDHEDLGRWMRIGARLVDGGRPDGVEVQMGGQTPQAPVQQFDGQKAVGD